MKLTTEQETVCKVFGRRDKHEKVHCRECPMRLDDRYAVCLKIVGKKEAEEEWDWDGDPYPAIHKRRKMTTEEKMEVFGNSEQLGTVSKMENDDLISRQAAIRWVKTECNPYGKPTLDFESGKKVMEHLEQMPSAQQWIPCNVELPEEGMDVLVTVYFMGLTQTLPNGRKDRIKPSYYVDIASRFEDDWSSATDEYKNARNRHKVVAWMPLPKPREGRRADD